MTGWQTDSKGHKFFFDPDNGGLMVTGWQRIGDNGKIIPGTTWNDSIVTASQTSQAPVDFTKEKRTHIYYFDTNGYMYQPPKDAKDQYGNIINSTNGMVKVYPHSINGLLFGFFTDDAKNHKSGELSPDSIQADFVKHWGIQNWQG
ncbi:hypothetical protein [Bacillus thuringiensis]